MSEKYIYGQPLYGQNNIQYKGMEGLQFGTYESTNYLQGANMNQIQFQHQQKSIYLNQNQGYQLIKMHIKNLRMEYFILL